MAKLHIGADNGKAPIKWSDYIGKNADEVIEEVKHYYQINPYNVMDEIESEKRYRKVIMLISFVIVNMARWSISFNTKRIEY